GLFVSAPVRSWEPSTMTIRVVCKQCHSKLDIREELAGSTRKCPKCKTEFVVPNAEEDDGVVVADDPAPELVATVETKASDTSRKEIPVESREPPLVPAERPAAVPGVQDDDDEEDDFMPSFVTEPAAHKSDAKKPLPSTSPGGDDDEPVFSIPKTPPPP